MTMRQLSNREKIIAGATIIMVVVYLVFFILIRPAKDMLAGIDDSIATSEQRLSKGKVLLERGSGVQKSMDSLVKEWGQTRSDAEESSQLINALESAATTADIRILNIEPRPIVRDTLVRYPIAMTVSGTSKHIIKFLSLIQAKPLALDVENLNLERSIDGNATINGTMVVTRLRIQG